MDRLREIVRSLRAPGGCPWDIEQTHESLIPCLLEEAYEAADAIRGDDDEHLQEEIGDLLLQAVMHAEIARGEERFDLDDVARTVGEKLVRRHPHVFGDSDASDTESVLSQWDEIKKQEKGDQPPQGYLHKVGQGLPALTRAAKLTKKAGKVGFDWDAAEGVLEKVDEELAEVREAMAGDDPAHVDEELGDLLFVVVNLCRKLDRDPETLLHATNQKFLSRFHDMEASLKDKGLDLEEAGMEKMEEQWLAAKVREKQGG